MSIDEDSVIKDEIITTRFELTLPKLKPEEQNELNSLLTKVSNIVIKNIIASKEKQKDCSSCSFHPICKILKKESCNDKAESSH